MNSEFVEMPTLQDIPPFLEIRFRKRKPDKPYDPTAIWDVIGWNVVAALVGLCVYLFLTLAAST